MGTVIEMPPTEAHERLTSAQGAVYLDVRSVPEWDAGHPTGSWNIPLFHATPQGMAPNPDFAAVVSAVLPRDAVVIVGCRSGPRSYKACEVLGSLGFSDVVNVAGGFGGVSDPATGRTLIAGWEACGLPSTDDPTAGGSWSELRARALGA